LYCVWPPPAAALLCCLTSITDLYLLLRISQRVLLCCLVQLSLHETLQPLLSALFGRSGSSSSARLQHRQALQQGPEEERSCQHACAAKLLCFHLLCLLQYLAHKLPGTPSEASTVRRLNLCATGITCVQIRQSMQHVKPPAPAHGMATLIVQSAKQSAGTHNPFQQSTTYRSSYLHTCVQLQHCMCRAFVPHPP
jgi:hypothetical protein